MHPIKRHLLRDGAKRAALRVGMSLFGASVFSEKSFSRFGDCLRRLCGAGMSLFGAFLFLEKSFWHFVDCLRRLCGAGMSLFGASVFSEKSFWHFVDCLRRLWGHGHVPFWGVLVLKKTWLMIGNVFQNCMFLIRLGLRFAVAVVKIFP